MLFEKVRAIICDYFDVDEDDVTPDTTFEELGADSLDMIDLVMSFEDEFRVEITDETLETFEKVEDAVSFIGNHS